MRTARALRLWTPVIGRLTSQPVEDVTQRRDFIAYSKEGDLRRSVPL